MTNRHVAQPSLEEKDIKAGYRNFIHAIRQYYNYQKQQLSEKFDELETAKGQYYDDEEEVLYDTPAGVAEIERQQEALRREYAAAEQTLEQLEQLDDPSALKISSVCEIGYCLQTTHTSPERPISWTKILVSC